MKPIITSFIDYNNASLNDQLDLINNLKLKHLIIRHINGKSLLLLNEDEKIELISNLKDRNILIIDPLIDAPNLDNDKEIEKSYEKITKASKLAKELNSEVFLLRIPKFNNFSNERNKLIEVLKKQTKIIKNHKLKTYLIFDNNNQAAVYRYILEKIKDHDLKMSFDLAYIYFNNENINTTYRLLKDYIDLIFIDDYDVNDTPRLLSHGDVYGLKSFLKELIINDYKGIVVLDSSLNEFLTQVKDYKWYNKRFSKAKKHHVNVLEHFKTLTDDVSIQSIIKIQLDALNIIFKI